MTPIEIIVEWVNESDKPNWWRHAIRIAMGHGEIDSAGIAILLEMARMEVGIIEKNSVYSANASPLIATGFEIEKEPVNLISLGNVKNVSSLIENQILTFSPNGLTVVYGDNGSGKSSYSKILKNACLTRGNAPEIMTNIFAPSSIASEATLSIVVGSTPVSFKWQNGADVISELKSIRVFDSNSALHYLSKEDSVEYKPAGLILIDELIHACKEIRNKIGAELSAVDQQKFIFPVMNPSTKASGFVKDIDENVSDAILDTFCATFAEVASLEGLRKELFELSNRTPKQMKHYYASKYQYLEPLQQYLDNLCLQLSDIRLQEISLLFDDQNNKLLISEEVRKQVFDGLPIDGVGTETWRSMWLHVQEFIMANGHQISFPPIEGDSCPTCLTPIDKVAAKRLTSFQNYLHDKSQVEATKAVDKYHKTLEELNSLSFDLSPYQGVLKALTNDSKEEIVTELKLLVSQLKSRQISLLSENPIFTHQPLNGRVPGWLSAQIGLFKAKENNVVNDEGLAKAIHQSEKAINEIEDRQIIANNRENIKKEIIRLSNFKKLKALELSTNSLQTTRLVTRISAMGSLGKLDEYFNSELKALGFKNFPVQAVTRGSSGQQKLKLTLPNHSEKIINIASEGEQNCIALAGFLAELYVDNRKSAIIFDDPVNSLDHKWRRLFAKRIAAEANHRQVIVLTHDLPFLKMLEEASNNSLHITSISRRGQNSGFPVERPPWDVLKTETRIKALRQSVIALQKYCESDGFNTEDYNNKAKTIYSKKRETWERLVEEWLIRNVVQRFSRNVQTSNIRYLVDNTIVDVNLINDAMNQCSTYLDGHDTAVGLGAIDMPDIDELDNDITGLEQYFKDLKARKNKLS